MKTRILALIAAIAVVALTRSVPAEDPGQWIDLFDGKTLKGWTQLNGTATYTVEDGAIVGRTAVGSPNSFLCTDKHYGDFELEFEVKCDKGLNSGVQIRSLQKTAADAEKDAAKPAPKAAKKDAGKNVAPDAAKKAAKQAAQKGKNAQEGRVFGPQVEIECGPGQAGYVYGEATNLKWLSEEPNSKDPAVKQHSYFKEGEWNRFRVIAKGPRIQTFINDQPIADLTHEGIYETHPKGFIGLQVHGIGTRDVSFQVAWRNIRLREIK